jgi:hypothetical protein
LTLFRTHQEKKVKLVYEEKASDTPGPFTRNAADFGTKVGALEAGGGGDIPESSLDALELASKQTFRADADRVIILITDAAPRLPDKNVATAKDAAGILKRLQVRQVHFMCPGDVLKHFQPIRDEFPGEHFELRKSATFTSILEKISRGIADISYKQRALTPSTVKKHQIRADILFLLDTTGSMGNEIMGVQMGIAAFARELAEKKLDARFGLIAFRDQTVDDVPLQVLTFRQEGFKIEETDTISLPDVQVLGPEASPWLGKLEQLNAVLDGILPSGAAPEQSSLDALALALRQPFRPEADKVLVLIADSPPVLPDREVIDPVDLVDTLLEKKIGFVHLHVSDAARPFLHPLLKATQRKVDLPGDKLSLSWIDTVPAEPPPLNTTAPAPAPAPTPAPPPSTDGKTRDAAPAVAAGIGVWLAFAAATAMALSYLIASFCLPLDLTRQPAFADLPRALQRYGPVLAAQGFAVVTGLLWLGLT